MGKLAADMCHCCRQHENEHHLTDREVHDGLGEHGIERVEQEAASPIERIVSVVRI